MLAVPARNLPPAAPGDGDRPSDRAGEQSGDHFSDEPRDQAKELSTDLPTGYAELLETARRFYRGAAERARRADIADPRPTGAGR